MKKINRTHLTYFNDFYNTNNMLKAIKEHKEYLENNGLNNTKSSNQKNKGKVDIKKTGELNE